MDMSANACFHKFWGSASRSKTPLLLLTIVTGRRKRGDRVISNPLLWYRWRDSCLSAWAIVGRQQPIRNGYWRKQETTEEVKPRLTQAERKRAKTDLNQNTHLSWNENVLMEDVIEMCCFLSVWRKHEYQCAISEKREVQSSLLGRFSKVAVSLSCCVFPGRDPKRLPPLSIPSRFARVLNCSISASQTPAAFPTTTPEGGESWCRHTKEHLYTWADEFDWFHRQECSGWHISRQSDTRTPAWHNLPFTWRG